MHIREQSSANASEENQRENPTQSEESQNFTQSEENLNPPQSEKNLRQHEENPTQSSRGAPPCTENTEQFDGGVRKVENLATW